MPRLPLLRLHAASDDRGLCGRERPDGQRHPRPVEPPIPPLRPARHPGADIRETLRRRLAAAVLRRPAAQLLRGRLPRLIEQCNA